MRALPYQEVVAALRSGDRIMVTHPDPFKVSEKTIYSLVQSGRPVGKRTWQRLVDDLEAVPDGLFADGAGQTYALKPTA